MATIALYAGKLNEMPGLLADVKNSVVDYKNEMFELKNQALKIRKSVCNLDDVISSIQTATQTQEEKCASLETFQRNNIQFIEDVSRIDSEVADMVEQRKDDFYDKYYYLKPDYEKTKLEEIWDSYKSVLISASEWCKEHWKEILATVAIIFCAVLAITLVVCTGGMALAPLLTGLMATLGVASGTAVTVATVISLAVGSIAVTSTIAAATLNIIDIWGDMSDNPTFQSWKTAMNWTSAISNLFYLVGIGFNSVNGITCTQTSKIFNNGIAIGESMEMRVIPYTSNNGLGYYHGLWGYKIIYKYSQEIAMFLGKIQNKNFINWAILHGIKIFDIGPKGPQITSEYYQMEQELLKNYVNLFKMFLN